MNIKEALDILGLTQEEYEKMNVVMVTKAYTKARMRADVEEQSILNQAYSVLSDYKKSRVNVTSMIANDYNNIGIKMNVKPIVNRKANSYKASIPYKKGVDQLVAPLQALFNNVEEHEFIITPPILRPKMTVFGIINDSKIPYELVLV